MPKSDSSSDFYNGELQQSQETPRPTPARNQSQVRFLVNEYTEGNYRDDEPIEIRRTRNSKLSHSSASPSPGTAAGMNAGNNYFETA
jgi:hypothetical protein